MKAKRNSFFWIAFIMVVLFFGGVLFTPSVSLANDTVGDELSGEGTNGNPFLVSSPEDLNQVRYNLDACYLLTNDIEFKESDFAEGGRYYNNGEGWIPIGIDQNQPFTGSFDGGGHIIKGYYVNCATKYAGLFGYNEGLISDLDVEPQLVTSQKKPSTAFDVYGGAVVGYNNFGKVSGCYNTGEVKLNFEYGNAGGICGYNNSIVITGSINLSTSGIWGCENAGPLTGWRCGGIAANNDGTISWSINRGPIQAVESGGGIAGTNNGVITQSYSIGSVVVSNSRGGKVYAGGIAGQCLEGTIWESYSYTTVQAVNTVSGTSNSAYSGGIAGTIIGSTIENCYSGSEVTAMAVSNKSYAGGIVGSTDNYINTRDYLKQCFNIGVLSGRYVGGIVGVRYIQSGLSCSNCYYYGGRSNNKGLGLSVEQSSSGGSVESTTQDNIALNLNDTQFQTQSSFIGFDFDEIWVMADMNSDRPEFDTLFLPDLKRNPFRKKVSISVLTYPNQTEYLEGTENINVANGKISVTMNRGRAIIKDITEAMVDGFDFSKPGRQTITVTYSGLQTSFDIIVKHDLKYHEASAPRETIPGNEEYWSCEFCGKYFADAEGNEEIALNSWIIEALGHDWSDWVVTKSAVCAETGSKERICRTCGNKETEIIPATGHSLYIKESFSRNATCTEEGKTVYFCRNCDYAVEETIAPLGHVWDADGKCTRCGESKHKEGWVKDSAGIWHYYTNGIKSTGWKQVSGTWYLFDNDGAMLTGWQKNGGQWYYMQSSGAMVTGWVKDGNTWYYMNASGAMVTGWQKVNGTWYFFKSNGAMAANEWCEGYWLNANGSWTYQPRGSWKQNSTGWWFGDTSGWYAKSTTQKIDNVNYTFNAAGYWVQ